MSYANGIITWDTEIGVGDVQQALQTGMTEWWPLCTHKSINMWSKYKPVRSPYPDFSGLPFSNRTYTLPHYRSDWYKGENLDCGIELKTYTNAATLIREFTGTWNYKRLRLGTDFARITDFNGYNSKAVNPFVISSNGGMILSDGNYMTYPSVRCYLSENGVDYSHNLSIDDIVYRPTDGSPAGQTDLRTFFFGVVWEFGGTYFIKTAETNFAATGTGTFMKEINDFRGSDGNNKLNNGDNMMYPVLVNTYTPITVAKEFGGDFVIPLPLPVQTIKMTTLSMSLKTRAYFVDADGKEISSVTVQRSMNATVTLNFVFEVENNSGLNLAWSGYARVYYYYFTTGANGNKIKYVEDDRNFNVGDQVTNNGEKDVVQAPAQTYFGLYDTNWVERYPEFIYADYSIVFPTGFENVGASASIRIIWTD